MMLEMAPTPMVQSSQVGTMVFLEEFFLHIPICPQTLLGSKNTGYIARAIPDQYIGIPSSQAATSSASGHRTATRRLVCSAIEASDIRYPWRAVPKVKQSSQLASALMAGTAQMRAIARTNFIIFIFTG